MKISDRLIGKIEEAICYVEDKQEKLQPLIDRLELILLTKEEELSVKDAFDMYMRLQEQHTNSIILLTKLREVQQSICKS